VRDIRGREQTRAGSLRYRFEPADDGTFEGDAMQDEDAKTTSSCAIAVMAKASIPGRTKTRLSPFVTPELAADLNTAFLRDVADNLLAAAALASIGPWMAYAPAGSQDFFARILPDGVGLLETTAPGFGACLYRAGTSLLAAGHESVCLLNSDSPTLPTGYLVAAATALAAPGDRVVLGPAIDGGYYLIGMKQPHRRLFEEVDWSTERVFRQTLERADELDLPVFLLPSWYDVDCEDALRVLIGELIESRPFRTVGSRPTSAAFTRRCLLRLLETVGAASGTDLKSRSSRVA
jgi:rSAM/selenodomain-associated transferase 1